MAAGFGDMQSLLKQAQDMQRRMQETQQALSAQMLEGTAGGGAVTVCVNGNQELQSIKIDPAAVDPGDVEAQLPERGLQLAEIDVAAAVVVQRFEECVCPW